MANQPVNPDEPVNAPDVVVENVLGAQVGNPPILPADEAELAEGEHPEPPDGALIDHVVTDPTVPPPVPPSQP